MPTDADGCRRTRTDADGRGRMDGQTDGRTWTGRMGPIGVGSSGVLRHGVCLFVPTNKSSKSQTFCCTSNVTAARAVEARFAAVQP
eukprot:552372-Prymnesium_polylepis.1